MFDFGRANKDQKKAITSVLGPVLITAGPGTGKTTLAKKLVNEYGYKYVNDWEIFIENNIVINEIELFVKLFK